MGRKRCRPRIEDLIRINVHHRILNHDKRSLFDPDGNRFDFIDEVDNNGNQLLRVFFNQGPTDLAFSVVEKKKIDPHGNRFSQFFASVGGKLVSHLYIDPVQKKVGSRHELAAI